MPELTQDQKDMLAALDKRREEEQALKELIEKKASTQRVIIRKVLIGLSVVALLFTALIFFMLSSNGNGGSNAEPTPTILLDQPTPEPTPDPLARPGRTTAYLAATDDIQNIFVIELTGEEKLQITQNDLKNVTFQHLQWKTADELAFSRCNSDDLRCSIETYSLSRKEFTTEVEANSFFNNTTITTFAFDSSGTQLAYMQQAPDKRTFIQLKQNGTQITLKELPAGIDRAINFEDSVSLSFSPDNRHLLVVNTLIQPNTTQTHETLWVFDTNNGQERFGVGRPIQRASHALWLNNTTIAFKFFNGEFVQKNIHTQGEITLSTEFETHYSPNLSPDQNNILFWSFPTIESRSQVGVFSLQNRNRPITLYTKDFIAPEWVSQTQVVALETRTTPGDDFFSPTGRLMLIRLANSSTLELVPHSVLDFALEPEL